VGLLFNYAYCGRRVRELQQVNYLIDNCNAANRVSPAPLAFPCPLQTQRNSLGNHPLTLRGLTLLQKSYSYHLGKEVSCIFW